ncbi:hypothetical protein HZS_3931 [Henneguya salminicola]|nr:hypothetical protein HZS_3931 [Henneguya salminicola]
MIFVVEVPDRAAYAHQSALLIPVRSGPTMIADCFISYCCLSNIYTPLTVNHSVEFIDSLTCLRNNAKEGPCYNMKIRMAPRNITCSYHEINNKTQGGINDHLGKSFWKRKNNLDVWNQFINAIRTVEYTYV